MREVIKKVFIIIFFINIIFLNMNIVKAEGMSNIIDGGDSFMLSGKNGKETLNKDNLKTTSTIIYNTLVLTGMAVAVIIAGILGVKFMIGSVEEKAQIKESIIPFIIGCIVIFGAFGIWKIVITLGNKLGSYNI